MELNVPLVNRNRCAVGSCDLYNIALALFNTGKSKLF